MAKVTRLCFREEMLNLKMKRYNGPLKKPTENIQRNSHISQHDPLTLALHQIKVFHIQGNNSLSIIAVLEELSLSCRHE